MLGGTKRPGLFARDRQRVRRWRRRRCGLRLAPARSVGCRVGDRRRRRFDRAGLLDTAAVGGRLDRRRPRVVVGLRLDRLGLLDQSRRTERRRGRLGRLGRGRGAPFLPGAAFAFAAVLTLDGLLREHVALRQRDALLLGEAIDELARDDLFERARRALELDAVVLLQQRQHVVAGDVEKLSDLVNPNSGQTGYPSAFSYRPSAVA